MTYDDFPACLTRYAWLLDQGDRAFDCLSNCKACGETVPRSGWMTHLREHRRALAGIKRRQQTDAAKRLRQINRLRREALTANRAL